MVAQPIRCDPFTNHSARRQTVKKYNLRSKSKNGNHGLRLTAITSERVERPYTNLATKKNKIAISLLSLVFGCF